MENQDKIVEQFKNAAQKAELKDFEALEKVWSRVDAKLDTRVQKAQHKNWKKFAIAASIVIITVIELQYLKSEQKTLLPEKNVVVTPETISTPTDSAVVNMEATPNTILESKLKPNAKQILNQQINSQQTIVAADMIKDSMSLKTDKSTILITNLADEKSNAESSDNDRSSGRFLRRQIYEARGIQQPDFVPSRENETAKTVVQQAPPPLVVIDGKPINTKKEANFSSLDDEDIENVMVLKEPLYIINGVQYSEEELFGKNPTSPYAPLDQQEIEKIEILQEQEALDKYGKKGEKGVVIIATKNHKPAPKK
jgi:hypothetical protein